jgi:hypothetical protein
MEDFRIMIDAAATSTVSMRFVRPLSNNRSLYRFHFRFPPSRSSTSVDLPVYLDSGDLESGNAADFFRKLEQLVYMDPPDSGSVTNPPMIYAVEAQYSDGAGGYLGKIKIEMDLGFSASGPGAGKSIPWDSIVTFNLTLTPTPGSPQTAIFTLSGFDTLAFYGFFNDVLSSNPPNPPH